MYRGFNLKVKLDDKTISEYKLKGAINQRKYKDDILAKFKAVVKENNRLDATIVEQLFFPQIEADVFISHSHNNENEVMALAGLLNQKLGLKVFIDSCAWESAKDLQRILDNEHSWIDPVKKDIYSYPAVGKSSSHAHMLLTVALSKMINSTECILFYNSPESITPYENYNSTTSPWIYAEIALTHIVEKKIPKRRESLYTKLMSNRSVNESFDLFYPADLTNFAPINDYDFNKWINQPFNSSDEALDSLYKQIPLTPKSKFL